MKNLKTCGPGEFSKVNSDTKIFKIGPAVSSHWSESERDDTKILWSILRLRLLVHVCRYRYWDWDLKSPIFDIETETETWKSTFSILRLRLRPKVRYCTETETSCPILTIPILRLRLGLPMMEVTFGGNVMVSKWGLVVIDVNLHNLGAVHKLCPYVDIAFWLWHHGEGECPNIGLHLSSNQ